MAVQDDNPRIKLWQTLSDQGKYTKPYEEFFQQFNTPEKIQKLYGALNGDGSYTKSYDEFTAQYFDGLGKPTGVSAQGSAATSTTSVEPSPSANVPTGSSTLPTGSYTEQSSKDNNSVLNSIYSKFPAFRNMGDINIIADRNFTREKTGVGDIETFVNNENGNPIYNTVTYENGFKITNPTPNKTTVIYNPDTNNEQNVALDLLHGMTRDGNYNSVRNDFKKAFLNSENGRELDLAWQDYNKETRGNNDGKQSFIENEIDGVLRNLLFEGSDEEFSKSRYSREAKDLYLSDQDVRDSFNRLNSYLRTGSVDGNGDLSAQQLPPLADPTNIAPQIQQANRIASEYDQEGESFLFEVPEGFEIVEGDVDENNRLLDPFMRNLTTGERFNIIRPTDPTTLEQAARLREQGAGAINPDKVTFTESIANSWKNMLDRFESIPMRQEIANGGMLQIRPEALANMTDQQRDAAFEQARQNYYNAYEALEQFQRENPGAPTREIVESWQNNDASGLVAGAFNALTGFATSLALGSLSGGVPLAVDIVGDFKADYNEEKAKSMGMTTRELAERGLAEDKAPVILAGISYAGEKLGLEGIGRFIPKSVIQSVARKVTSSPYAKAMLKGVIDAGGEGLTEVLSQGLQDTSTELATKEDYTGGEVFERLIDNTFDEKNWENFWQGVIGKGLMSGSGAVTNTLLRRSASNPELKNKVEQLIEVAGTIGNNAENNPAMNMVFNNLVTEVSQGIADDALVRESLSEPQQDRISNLEGQVVMLEDSKQQAGDNEVLNGAIDSEIQRAQTEIENIKTDAVEQGDLDMAGSSVADALSPTNPIVVLLDGEQGVVRLDGQTVVFETADTVRELGNVDQISDSDLSVFGLDVEQPLNIDVSADNSVTIDGTTFQNINEDPMSALNYNENGDVVSVTLQNENGRNRTIRGQRAQEIAYLYTLKEFEQNATEEQIQSVIQDVESIIPTTQEDVGVDIQATDGNIEQTQQTEPIINETQQASLESAEILSESSQVAPIQEIIPQTLDDGIIDVTENPVETIPSVELAPLTEEVTPIEGNVSDQVESVSKDVISTPNERTVVSERTRKAAIQKVSDRLSKTGLISQVDVVNSETLSKELANARGARVESSGRAINGFYDQSTGRIVINEDTASIDTPIHEFAHAWEQLVEKENPQIHSTGVDLIQTLEGQPYVDFVRQTQPSLEGRELYKEALVQAIGDRGARLVESQQNSLLRKWLRDAWKFIGDLVGISGMTADQIGNLTLNEYADAVATDLLSGQPYRRMPNGDIVAQTEATSESQMDEKEKFMNDFILRMKKRNGINFQGTVDGSLSPEDLTDLVTFFRFAAEKGQLDRIEDARATAKMMGINSPSQVDMAYRLAKLQVKDSTGFKKAEVSLETITKTDFTKLSDDEYRELGKRLVDDGLVVPQTLVANIIEEPRALQPWEVTSLQYYRTQIESQIADASDLVESGNQSGIDAFVYTLGSENITGYKGIAAKMEVVNAALFDLEVAMLTTANQQSAAFRLRSLMSDKDFNVVQYLAEMKARGYVDPAIEQKLKDLSAELNTVRAKLKRKSEEAERLAERITEGNINQEASQPVRQTRRVRVKKATVNAVNTVLDALDLESFGLPRMRFQANNTIRFQANSDNALSEAVGNSIAQMRNNITEGNLSVSDAIEQAISEVNGIVGEGNWDSVKFRSTIANQLVQQSIPVKVKKPYVNSEGVLIVPGEYIKQLVRDGRTTIDDMVVAVQGETGGAFDSYDIRNAISGYGRQTASKRTDLDRKVAKARRVARLLSQIEDLTTKGERLKTQRQVHENDTEINNLKEQVRQLEYDLEMTPEERAQLAEIRYNEGRRKYLTNYIEQLQERIDNKDFAPVRHQNKFEEDAETRELRAQAERVKNEFKKEKYRHELENRTKWEKWRTLAYDVIFNITRGLSAGADASAIGVQGAIFSAARPRQAYKVLAGSLPGTFSEEQYEAYFSDLQADPLYDVARKAGLNMQLPNFYQSVQEEQYKGQLPELLFNHLILDPISYVGAKATGRDVATTREVVRDKANVFTLGDRNYSLVLSQIRMDLFREFITNQQNKLGLNLELDDAAVKRVASVVNDITMASKVPGLQGKTANDIISAIMFSARKFVATWKILGGWIPLLAGPNKNYQLFKDAYGSVIGRGLGTMFLTAAIPTAISSILKSNQEDDDEEDPYFYNPHFFDPRHSDFLKLKAENTRISLFQGIDGNVVFATRFISGEYMTSSSQQVRPLNGEGFNKDRLELSWDYISNKFAPTASIAVSTLQGDRERQEAYGRFQESLAPMWATGIREQYENTGNTLETGTLATLGFFGLSYNNYGGAEFAKGRGTDNKKARDIFQKSGLSAYDPAEGQRTYWNGEEIVKVTDKVAGEKTYTDKYLPAYQQFMTEAVISKENKLARDVNWEIKEGVIKELKREAYKYAEIKTSGIQAKGNFATFSDDGTKYHLLESQYNIKADYIKEYMDRQANRDRKEARQEVAQKLREDKIKPTDGYRQMLIELNLYNRANKYANERLIRDMKRRKIKLVKQAEYNSDMETQEEE